MASSSSPMTKKPTNGSHIRQTLFKKPSSAEATRSAKRLENIFKKANELSILCGVEVCVIYYGSHGELKTWPEDREKVKDMARRYSELSEMKRRVKQVDLDLFLETISKEDDSKKKKRVKLGSSYKYPDWDPRFDYYSVEQLEELIQSLERSETMMQHRLQAVVESQRQRNMHYTNMAGQEQIITTTSAATNHLQQHSSQVSMDLFNPRSSTLPQIQASTSASNPAYSLAPVPDSLTIYQDQSLESCLRLLGIQETGMNEVFNTTMLPYNGFNTNGVNVLPNQFYQNCFKVDDPSGLPGAQETGTNSMNVVDHSGLLWGQGTGMNGLQNMDMYYNNNIDMYGYNNNNTNGFAHQLVQSIQAPPVYHQ